jgi:hypothetical protein
MEVPELERDGRPSSMLEATHSAQLFTLQATAVEALNVQAT